MKVHDELLELCGVLRAEGIKLTYDALRDRRGGGSRRDIACAILAWREQQANFAMTAALKLPNEFTQSLEKLGPKLWKVATQNFADALQEMKAELQLSQHYADEEISHLHDLICKQLDEIEQLKLRLQKFERST